MSYRIKSVERLTGLSRNTITAWERRYDLLEPRKDASGYRVYSDEDVELLKRVKSLTETGSQIGEVVARLRAERNKPLVGALPDGNLDGVRAELLSRLLDFDRAGADEVHARLMEVSFRQRIDDVYLPVLRALGDGWADGSMTIAQEHFASTFVREQLVGMLKSLDQGPSGGPLVVCAGYPGERHELGLLAIAIHLALRGHRVLYLGLDLPLEELIRTVEDHPADLVCQSLVHPAPETEVLAHAEELRRRLDPRTLVVLGGPGVAPLTERSREGLLFCASFEDLLQHWDQVRSRRVQRVF